MKIGLCNGKCEICSELRSLALFANSNTRSIDFSSDADISFDPDKTDSDPEDIAFVLTDKFFN